MRDLFTARDICLGLLTADDTATLAAWYLRSDFLRLVDTDAAFPKTEEEAKALETPTPNSFPFLIRLRKSGEAIGFVALHSVEWNNGSCLLSVGIGEGRHRGKGYARQALELALQYAFCELNLHRVGLDVIAYNKRALKLYEGLGFVHEGRSREAVHRDGVRYDRVNMGILRSEWKRKPEEKA